MSIDNIAVQIIHLPRLFKSLGNKSFHLLLKDTGYFEKSDQISEEEIRKALSRHPDCVEEWKFLSDDKRTSFGWYFKELDKGTYVVGYFNSNRRDNPRAEFSNIQQACAFFIKQEIEDIKSN